MRLSTAAELGIRGMVYLARNYKSGPLPMTKICREQKLPRQYMLKIFASLGRSGFVRTTRGKGGGFVLGRPPEKISILDIIQAIEGPLVLNFCQSDPPACRWDEDHCPIRPLWSELQEFTVSKLGGFSLDKVNHQPD